MKRSHFIGLSSRASDAVNSVRAPSVTPAQAGVQKSCEGWLDSRLRGNDMCAVLSMGLVASVMLAGLCAAASAGSDDPNLAWWRDSMKTHDQRIAWWRDARFGMFVHWGVYAHLGGTWQGQAVKGYAEHIQRILKIPIPIYREQVAGQFNPTEFNADEWIRTAKEAGMGYFIITAKHHDGFAMWDSKVNSYNIVQATPFKRDPMKELRAACLKYGVKFGFYYSHAFDWGDPNGPGNDWDYDNPGGDRNLHGGRNWWQASPELLPKVRTYVDGKSIPQILELIENYEPDILWFDTPHKLPPEENLQIMKTVRAAAPNVVINGRLVRGMGDYDSTADRPAEFSPHEGDWEGIPTTNESYGWNQNDNSHKPASHFIQLLAKAAARGGNVLMNVGPMGNGKIDPKDTAILQGIGAWWKVNGESIRGTTRTPLPVQSWGESTRKGNTLYLHVFQWPADGRLILGGLRSEVKRAWLLADAGQSRSVTRLNPLDFAIDVPTKAPDAADSVIALECGSSIETDSARLLSPTAANALRAFNGQLHGRLSFGPGKQTDAYVQNWSRTDDSISWPVRVNSRSTFSVVAVYDAQVQSDGSTFTITVGSQHVTGTVKSGAEQTISLGTVILEPGPSAVTVTPKEIKGSELMRLRTVELKPTTDR